MSPALPALLRRISAQTTDRRGFLVSAAAFALAGRWLRAQQAPPQADTLKVEAKLVNVFATVRDKKGALVQDLKKEDFTLEEDGHKQEIRFFSHENNLPLTLGILVDTSPSEEKMLDQERNAARTFLEHVLDVKKDRAFVLHFDTSVELLQDLTNSMPKLEKALTELEDVQSEKPQLDRKSRDEENFLSRQDDDRQSSRGGGPGGGGGGTTHLFDAVYLASTDILKNVAGRKALIVIGDGDDMGSSITKRRAIQAALKADAIVYCIRIVDKDFGKDGKKRNWSLPGGLGIPGMGGPGGGGPGGGGPGSGGQGPGGGGMDRNEGKKNMQALADQTGGALYEVSKKTSLGDIFAQIEQELRSQYSLGYTPPADAAGGYRHIKLTTKKSSLTVQARDGYYPDRTADKDDD